MAGRRRSPTERDRGDLLRRRPGRAVDKLGDGYQDALAILKEFRDASIICLPGHAWDSDDSKVVIEAAIGHAEAMRNRMVIVDPKPREELRTQKSVLDQRINQSSYAALYYPWVDVANPFYDRSARPTSRSG